jgi:hypothetical protein
MIAFSAIIDFDLQGFLSFNDDNTRRKFGSRGIFQNEPSRQYC